MTGNPVGADLQEIVDDPSRWWELPAPIQLHLRMKRRLMIRLAVGNDVAKQAAVMSHCRDNPTDWINDWCWTYDPRNILFDLPTSIPFDLWDKQKELVKWFEDRAASRKGGVVEKSRDTGMTWTAIAFTVHAWLFKDGFAGGLGSRKEILVDRKGDPDCLFEKARHILRWLPPWMIPDGFNWDRHDNHMRLENPANGATITGEAGDQIGRGGRKTWYFVDEGAYLKDARSVDASLSRNTDCAWWGSTPSSEGMASLFAQKRFSGRLSVFILDWKDDPGKDQEWYDEQVEEYRYNPDVVAREIDRQYGSTSANVVIPGHWVQAAIDLKIPVGTVLAAGLDVAGKGSNLNVNVVRRGPVVTRIDDWPGDNTTDTAYRARAILEEEQGPRPESRATLNFDEIGVGEGVRSAYISMLDPPPFVVRGINVGSSPSDRTYDGKDAKELFRNLRAELWWAMRRRFHRTWEHVNEVKTHPTVDLISIPNHSELIAQLSVPTFKYLEGGKIKVQSKDEMLASPDHADATVIAFDGEGGGSGDSCKSWLEGLL